MKREIDKQHAITRTAVPAIDEVLGWAFPVLDHGFIRIIDYMGDDAAVVQMARVSYGAGTKGIRDDRGLLRYLMRHIHSSPFEGNEIKLHVKLPIFVARQWIRHRTANVNEYSARYSVLDREFYIPEPEVMAKQSASNKQGRGEVLDPATAEVVRRVLLEDAARAYDHYEQMIYSNPDDPDDPDNVGLARELARINLPANIYTQWYWKTDLHNLLKFIMLRADSHAQYEIRQYADTISDLCRKWVPEVMSAADEYLFGSTRFSANETSAIRSIFEQLGIDLNVQTLRNRGMSPGEIREFAAKVGSNIGRPLTDEDFK